MTERLCCGVCGEQLKREVSLTSPDVFNLDCPRHGTRAFTTPVRGVDSNGHSEINGEDEAKDAQTW